MYEPYNVQVRVVNPETLDTLTKKEVAEELAALVSDLEDAKKELYQNSIETTVASEKPIASYLDNLPNINSAVKASSSTKTVNMVYEKGISAVKGVYGLNIIRCDMNAVASKSSTGLKTWGTVNSYSSKLKSKAAGLYSAKWKQTSKRYTRLDGNRTLFFEFYGNLTETKRASIGSPVVFEITSIGWRIWFYAYASSFI
jgi:hypothetical protein